MSYFKRSKQSKVLNSTMADPNKPNITDDLICPITLELPVDPVTAEDGRVYERGAIEQYFEGKCAGQLVSPITKEKMGGKKLLPAIQTKNHIETLIKNGVITGSHAEKWEEKVNQKKKKEELLKKAKAGNVEAMLDVGDKYTNGENGFERDYNKAYLWYKKAHTAGSLKATARLGVFLTEGLVGDPNYVQGFAYLGMAAKESNLAAYMLGMGFTLGMYGLEAHPEEAKTWLERVVENKCTIDDIEDWRKEKARKQLEELNKDP